MAKSPGNVRQQASNLHGPTSLFAIFIQGQRSWYLAREFGTEYAVWKHLLAQTAARPLPRPILNLSSGGLQIQALNLGNDQSCTGHAQKFAAGKHFVLRIISFKQKFLNFGGEEISIGGRLSSFLRHRLKRCVA